MPEADALDRMLEVDRQMARAAEIEHPLRRLPEHLRPGLRAYLLERQPVGAFLRAVLVNDLHGAVSRADDESYPALREIVAFVHMHAPAPSHGSFEAYTAWIEGAQ